LDNAETEVELEHFAKNLVDRFGAIPKPTLELINTIRLRWIAKEMGFEKVVLKQQTFVGYFVTNQKSAFYQSPFFIALMQHLTRHPMKAKMKEKNNKLSIVMEQVKTLDQAVTSLGNMLAEARAIAGEQTINKI
jgi:transcription-repair coupling factor (superfamily II helicase)